MKKYILIIAITALCIGKINSQVITVPDDNLTLSGTQTGNNEHKALNTIESTQVINSGNTTYTAGDEIILNPGFEVKLGAEFEAIIDDLDNENNLTLMTYNLSTETAFSHYEMHAKVIKACNPDVVAVQEVAWDWGYRHLRDSTGYKATRKCTRGWDHLFTVMLWKPELGTPTINKKRIRISTPILPIRYNAYIIAEFTDFCFIATHIDPVDKDTVMSSILNHDVVKNCKNAGKPIYFAGDMNMEPHDEAMMGTPNSPGTLNNAGFEVLNDTDTCEVKTPNCTYYKYWTSHGRFLKDLILECNTNPKRKIIERGIPLTILENLGWKFLGDSNHHPDHYPYYHPTDYNSDHFPYVVKVKIK